MHTTDTAAPGGRRPPTTPGGAGQVVTVGTVTVRKVGRRFTCEYSRLPGKVFGPWMLAEMVRDLTVAALLSPLDARNLALQAAASATGAATTTLVS